MYSNRSHIDQYVRGLVGYLQMIWQKDTSADTNLPMVARGCFANYTCTEGNYHEKQSKRGACQTNKNTNVKVSKEIVYLNTLT